MSQATQHALDAFRQGLTQSTIYPQNLNDKHTSSATLKSYHWRLTNARKLLLTDETDAEIQFRDFTGLTTKFERKKVWDLDGLKQHLGSCPPAQVAPTTGTNHAWIADPRCRFVFMYGQHSLARLRLTLSMLVELLSYHQVVPDYLEFMFMFGSSSRPNDVRFSGFREHTFLKAPSSTNIDALNRSGQYYAMSFNLKTVQILDPATPDSWTIRQAAIYHRFDLRHGSSLWLITRALGKEGKLDLKERIEDLTGPRGRSEDRDFGSTESCFVSSLAVHSMLLHWAEESWQRYLQSRYDAIDSETQAAIHGTRDRKDNARRHYSAEDLQRIHVLEDSANEATAVLNGNMKVLAALQDFYVRLSGNSAFPLSKDCQNHVDVLAKQIQNTIYDMEMHKSRAQALAHDASSAKQLIVQYIQTQTSEYMESLTKSTYSVGISAQNEAVVMRVITVVALVYLPGTFVSSFFSTDVVKYQNQQDGLGNNVPQSEVDGVSYSVQAMQRWAQVTLPLTILTLVLAYIGYKWAQRRQQKEREQVLNSLELV